MKRYIAILSVFMSVTAVSCASRAPVQEERQEASETAELFATEPTRSLAPEPVPNGIIEDGQAMDAPDWTALPPAERLRRLEAQYEADRTPTHALALALELREQPLVPARANDLLRIAAQAGIPKAQALLGAELLLAPDSRAEALEWLHKAAPHEPQAALTLIQHFDFQYREATSEDQKAQARKEIFDAASFAPDAPLTRRVLQDLK